MIIKLAQRAETTSRTSLVVSVVASLCILMLPVSFWLIRQYPHDLYARFYDYRVTMESFEIIDDIVIFNDTNDGRNTKLSAPLEYFPESDFIEGNAEDIFDRLALLNNYYTGMLLPVILLISTIASTTLLSLSGMLAGMMGLGRKMTHKLSMTKRLRVFAVCFWLPAIPATIIGFILPVFHLFIYQLMLGYLAWRVQKVM
ncbi:MAG: hypothetical protein LBC71_06195 [Oscillospiraceae bacterium]|jgi:hypothetical protein|nr:hypothetical protein [Oscillospiraceae bacterium]